MIDAKIILKNAFIDANIPFCDIQSHTFSKDFDESTLSIYRKSKNKLFEFINTTGKRVACVIIALIICFTTTVFSVEALRTPFIEAVQNLFVNVRERLSGTQASNIALYFTDDITKIVATNYLTTIPKEHIIEDSKKIAEFTALLAETEWKEPENEYEAVAEYVYWRFEFINPNGTNTVLNMSGLQLGGGACVEIEHKDISRVFTISEQTYKDILAFTNKKYYLHKSDKDLPSKTHCLEKQNQALSELTDDERQYVGKALRGAHIQIELMLLDNVVVLKDRDSKYWLPAITGEEFTDPFSNETYINGEWCFNNVIGQLKNIADIIKDKETKIAFETMYTDLQAACDYRDIGSIFAVHEYIHDYDYFAINHPPHYEMYAPDWQGLDDYFGHIS